MTLQKEEDRLRRKAESQQASTSASVNDIAALAASTAQQGDDFETDEEDEDEAMLDDADGNLKTHAKSLRSVISISDIIIQVLDARDPLGTRTLSLEKEIQQHTGSKKLVFVLNKIDLVPKENVVAWLRYLRASFPTLAFKSSTQAQRNNLSSSAGSAGASATSTNALLTLLKNYAHGTSKGLTIGVIGLPNVGKSSLINTLKRSKACSVAPTPGWTKDVQTVVLDGGLKILDCPGVVLDSSSLEGEGLTAEQDRARKVLRNAVQVDKLVDPITPGTFEQMCNRIEF